jgi:hypothetical protein
VGGRRRQAPSGTVSCGEQRRRKQDQIGDDRAEDVRRRTEQERRAEGSAGERREEQHSNPAPALRQLAPEAHRGAERSRPEADRAGDVRDDGVAADPEQRREGNQRSAPGDGVDHPGDERREENDEGVERHARYTIASSRIGNAGLDGLRLSACAR